MLTAYPSTVVRKFSNQRQWRDFISAVQCSVNYTMVLNALRAGEDEGRPLGVAFQKEASNRPLLLRPKGVVVSELGKAAA